MTTEHNTEARCAGLEGCHELEGVMYDLFVHDPNCPKSSPRRNATVKSLGAAILEEITFYNDGNGCSRNDLVASILIAISQATESSAPLALSDDPPARSLPRESDFILPDEPRFALSGYCDNGAHSSCPYPDKCKCACHKSSSATSPDTAGELPEAAEDLHRRAEVWLEENFRRIPDREGDEELLMTNVLEYVLAGKSLTINESAMLLKEYISQIRRAEFWEQQTTAVRVHPRSEVKERAERVVREWSSLFMGKVANEATYANLIERIAAEFCTRSEGGQFGSEEPSQPTHSTNAPTFTTEGTTCPR